MDLGLLLATFLAMSGAAWFALFTGTPIGRIVLMAHKLAGNLMWAYLIAHASAALLHQAARRSHLRSHVLGSAAAAAT